MLPELKKGDLFVGRYEIEKVIGKGGMATVYRAKDRRLDTHVAIKTLSEASRAALERFTREARAIAKVKSEYVVRIYDFGDDEGRPYIAMEYLRGRDLGSVLRKEGHLPIPRATDIVTAMAIGLWACHFKHSLIHRDIKPKNVFLHHEDDGNEGVKLLDFGVSVYPFAAEVTGPNLVAGTLNYMSPEQASGRTVDAQSDQYSLAVVFYECLTGRLPYDGSTDKSFVGHLLKGHVTPPREYRPDLPAKLEEIICRALSLHPDDRFPSVREFGQSLFEFGTPEKQLVFTSRLSAPIPTAPSTDEMSLPHRQHLLGAETTASTIDNKFVPTVVANTLAHEVYAGSTAPDKRSSSDPKTTILSTGDIQVMPLPTPTPPRSRKVATIVAGVLIAGGAAIGLLRATTTADSRAPAARPEAVPVEAEKPFKAALSAVPAQESPSRPSVADSGMGPASPSAGTETTASDEAPTGSRAQTVETTQASPERPPRSRRAKRLPARDEAKKIDYTDKGSPILKN